MGLGINIYQAKQKIVTLALYSMLIESKTITTITTGIYEFWLCTRLFSKSFTHIKFIFIFLFYGSL